MKNFRCILSSVVVFLLLYSAMAYCDTWTTNKRLTNNAGYSEYPAIAVDGLNIYVAWADNTPGNFEIYFKKSIDGGVNWTTTKNLSNNAGYSYGPAIAVDGSNIYVVWHDDTPGTLQIYFKKSVDGGANWTTNKRLTYNTWASNYPSIAVNGSNIHVVWQGGTQLSYNPEIYFKKSDDGGNTWTTNKRLTNNAGVSWYPSIATDGTNICLVWSDDTPGNYEIYFKKSDDGGNTWTTNKRLTNNAGYSRFPSIAVDGSNIYVVWEDNTPGNYDIYFKKSDDGGNTWTTKNLSNTAGASFDSVVATDGTNIYVVWSDGTPGNFEIYFKKSIDGGANWTTRRLTNNVGYSYLPAIAVDGSNIYVVWTDSTPGNNEIYFKKGVLF